jgi:hypothetical protein
VHVESLGIEADTDEVHPVGARERGELAHTRPLPGVDTVYRIAGLSGRAHLYENAFAAVPGEQVELASDNAEVAGED